MLEIYQIIWFGLITVLFIGYFFLEGFDFGVGTLLPFLGKKDKERRVIINSIGPFWDGNEVWILTAGGAMFASFPHWYATLFSGFYLPLVFMLFALIIRGVAFEFRSLEEGAIWRNTWDWAIFIGSSVPALLWGVAFANFIKGVPIDETMTYTGGFFNLLNPFALAGGLFLVALFIYHGSLFLNLKTDGIVLERAKIAAEKSWFYVFGLAALYYVFAFVSGYIQFTGLAGGMAVLSMLALIISYWRLKNNKIGCAFTQGALAVVTYTIAHFASLFPNVMISSTNPAYNLTIQNASSSLVTLKTMTIIAIVLVPIVIAYQAWSFWIFRKRVSIDDKLKY